MDAVRRGRNFAEISNFKYIKMNGIGDYDHVSSMNITPAMMGLDRRSVHKELDHTMLQPGTKDPAEDNAQRKTHADYYKEHNNDRIYDNIKAVGAEMQNSMTNHISNDYMLHETPLVSENKHYMKSHLNLPQQNSPFLQEDSIYDNLKANSRLVLKSESDSNHSLQRYQNNLPWPGTNYRRLPFGYLSDHQKRCDKEDWGSALKEDNVYEYLMEEDIKLPRAKNKRTFKTLFCCGLNRYSRLKVRPVCSLKPKILSRATSHRAPMYGGVRT